MRSYLPGETRTLEAQTNINFAQGNITITEDNRPCIGDFGTSYAAFKSKAEVAAPFIDYIAPELNSRATGSDQPPTKEGDIYSFGKTIKTVCSPHTRRGLS